MAELRAFPRDNIDYSAVDMGLFMATRTAGVFSANNNLAVTAVGGMAVQISAGLAWLQWADGWGVASKLTEAETITLATAHATLHRIDTVIIRANKDDNKVETMVITGTPASSPVATAPVRNANYYDLVLAYIRVNAGATAITAANITDKRLDETVCGLMRDGVTQIPTSALQAQFMELLARLEGDIDDIEAGSATMLKSTYDPTGYAEQLIPMSLRWVKGETYNNTGDLWLSKTLVGRLIVFNNDSPVRITIPNDLMLDVPIGTEFEIMRNNIGQIMIDSVADVTVISPATASTGGHDPDNLEVMPQYDIAKLRKIGPNLWLVYGGVGIPTPD